MTILFTDHFFFVACDLIELGCGFYLSQCPSKGNRFNEMKSTKADNTLVVVSSESVEFEILSACPTV